MHTRCTSSRLCDDKMIVACSASCAMSRRTARRPAGSRATSAVEDDEVGIADQRLGEAETLPHAARVASDALAHPRQLGQFEQGRNPTAPFDRRHPGQIRAGLQVFAGAHPRGIGGDVGKVSESAPHSQAPRWIAKNADVAGIRASKAQENADGCRLPGSIGTQKRANGPAGLKAHIVQSQFVPEGP